ncbi:hypothetical protein KAK06_15175 [Ideonella sp. 4Y11]|uniref:Uncharacterized protein n=1 Tax=Ideonella aquatica TaxID=2824119 RepID=A0A940YW16_9BURK|nr:hypothetical protein [Ideonella aquatica]MBQ0960295.1 hypothetical protein [Ideonella aquatica]
MADTYRKCSCIAATILVAVLLSGCASAPRGLSISLTELGTESRVDAGSMSGRLRHRQSYNIAGTGAFDTIGMLSADPDPTVLPELWRSIFSKEHLPDQLALRITPGQSKVYVRDFDDGKSVTSEDVAKLRDTLQTLQGLAVESAIARSQATLLTLLKSTRTEATKTTDEVVLQGLVQREQALVQLLGSSGVSGLDSDASVDVQLDAANQRANMVDKAQGEAEAALRVLRAKPGIIVARWKLDSSKSRSIGATGIGYDSNDLDGGAGFVVLGGPRVLTLVAGDDLLARACSARGAICADKPSGKSSRDGMDSAIPSDHLYVTSYQLLARHAAWSDARSIRRLRSLSINLNAVIGSLSGLTGVNAPQLLAALKNLQVTLQSASSLAIDAENMGVLSGGKLFPIDFDFIDDDKLHESVDRVAKCNAEYLVISSMRSTLDGHVLRSSAEAPRWPTSKNSSSDKSCDETTPPEGFRKKKEPSTQTSTAPKGRSA